MVYRTIEKTKITPDLRYHHLNYQNILKQIEATAESHDCLVWSGVVQPFFLCPSAWRKYTQVITLKKNYS